MSRITGYLVYDNNGEVVGVFEDEIDADNWISKMSDNAESEIENDYYGLDSCAVDYMRGAEYGDYYVDYIDINTNKVRNYYTSEGDTIPVDEIECASYYSSDACDDFDDFDD